MFCHSGAKPKMDIFPIVATMAIGHKFYLAQILLGNYYRVMGKAVLMDPFCKMVGSCWLVQLRLFLYFLALKTSSSWLDLMDSFHGLAIVSCTSKKTMEEVLNYFRPLTFDIAPLMLLFFKENEPSYVPFLARRYFTNFDVPEHFAMWKCFT